MTEDQHTESYTSAEELREILLEIHIKSKAGGQKLLLADFLAEKFGLGKDNAARIRSILVLLDLVKRVQEEASSLDLEKRYLEQITGDTNFFRDRIWSLGSNAVLDTVAKNLPLDKIEALRYVEMVLASTYSYKNLDQEASNIAQLLEELSEEVLNSNLPDELRGSIYSQINSIRHSIGSYRIWGATAIERSVFSLSGELIVNSAVDDSVKNAPVTKKISGAMANLFSFLGNARKATDDGTKLISAGKKILENLPEL